MIWFGIITAAAAAVQVDAESEFIRELAVTRASHGVRLKINSLSRTAAATG